MVDVNNDSSEGSRELATVWRLPATIPPVASELERPTRMPEFWVRAHRVPDQIDRVQVRDTPYVLRGRDHEVAFMAKRIHSLPLPVQLVQGPPGAGKTSLLYTIGRYAAAQGYRVIKLQHAAFDSHMALADVFRNIKHPGDRTADTTTVTITERTDAGVGNVRQGADAGTTDTHSRNRPDEWIAAIRREARNPDHRGLIILLDEVQLLRKHDKGTTMYDRIQLFLQFMHNETVAAEPTSNGTPGFPAMMICAGLPDAEATLLHYELTRIEGVDMLGMGPIGERAAQQIIMDHMTAETKDGVLLPQLHERDLQRLVELCGGYAHHISHGAQNAQAQAMQARAEGRNEMSDEDVATIFQETKDAKVLHYEGRVRHRLPKERITEPVQVIAQATETWGEQLPIVAVDELVKQITEQIDLQTADLLNDLIANGILVQRGLTKPYPTAGAPTGGTKSHYVFAIPSMRSWLLETLAGDETVLPRRERNQTLIDGVSPPLPPEQRIPAWTWNQDGDLPFLPTMPPDEVWQPRTVDLEQVAAAASAPEPAHRIGHEAGDSAKATLAAATATMRITGVTGVAQRVWRWLMKLCRPRLRDAAAATQVDSPQASRPPSSDSSISQRLTHNAASPNVALPQMSSPGKVAARTRPKDDSAK